jgi:hypothetical protein
MSKRIDITGQTFANVLILEYIETRNTHAIYKCQCKICNSLMIASYSNLKSANTKSCASCGQKTHGKSKHPLYHRWQALKIRNILCDEWKDPTKFISDVEKTFLKKYSLRRIDNSKPHSPTNSFWTKPRTNHYEKSERIYFI